jgi:hypothetical protein
MQTAELDELITRLESEIKTKQKDLEIARQFRSALPRFHAFNGQALTAPQAEKQIPLMPEERSYGTVSDAVRSAIERCPVNYTIRDVERIVAETSLIDLSRNVISQVLHRLTRLGELKVLEKGRGRRPTLYTKEGA